MAVDWGDFQRFLRRYQYTRVGNPFNLYVFPMHVDEGAYTGKSTILCKVDLRSFEEGLKSDGGCLICGSFYNETNRANLVIGDRGVIGSIPWLQRRLPDQTFIAFDAPEHDILVERQPLVRPGAVRQAAAPVASYCKGGT